MFIFKHLFIYIKSFRDKTYFKISVCDIMNSLYKGLAVCCIKSKTSVQLWNESRSIAGIIINSHIRISKSIETYRNRNDLQQMEFFVKVRLDQVSYNWPFFVYLRIAARKVQMIKRLKLTLTNFCRCCCLVAENI